METNQTDPAAQENTQSVNPSADPVTDTSQPNWVERINDLIKNEKPDTNLISDGYHTFGELYEHRIINFMAVCRLAGPLLQKYVWRSKAHSDGDVWDGWFILGIGYAPGEQITYHLPIDKWDMCEAFTATRDKAPEWDGHSSEDVLERLKKLLSTVSK